MLIEEGGEEEEKTKQVAKIFSEPPMNKFPLSKQHGLVLMLHRAMEEGKKKENVKREEGGMIVFKNVIHQKRLNHMHS